MDPFLKDLIDAISKIGGLVTVIVGVIMACHQLNKSRAQKERELENRDRETKTQRAQFWLELRKMFKEHDEVHRMLRDGTWPHTADSHTATSNSSEMDINNLNEKTPSDEQLTALEAYMGLFEHCKAMIDDDLIDLPTFKSIYGYRVENILDNETVVKTKFTISWTRDKWKDFIALAEDLGLLVP